MSKPTKREFYIKKIEEILYEISMTPKTDLKKFTQLKAKAKKYLLKVETMKPTK